MFNKFFRRFQTVNPVDDQQHKLDCLRVQHADNPLMQLHLDRMQTALDAAL